MKLSALLLPLCLASLLPAAARASESLPPGAQVESIEITPKSVKLDSPYAYSQLIAMATLSTGDTVDVTRMAEVRVEGDGLRVDERGFVQADGDGKSEVIFSLLDMGSPDCV